MSDRFAIPDSVQGLLGRKNVAVYDEHRNSSRVFGVPGDALPAALNALKALRRNDPDLVQWIEDGHPTLTEAEHVQRFGHAYGKAKR